MEVALGGTEQQCRTIGHILLKKQMVREPRRQRDQTRNRRGDSFRRHGGCSLVTLARIGRLVRWSRYVDRRQRAPRNKRSAPGLPGRGASTIVTNGRVGEEGGPRRPINL